MRPVPNLPPLRLHCDRVRGNAACLVVHGTGRLTPLLDSAKSGGLSAHLNPIRTVRYNGLYYALTIDVHHIEASAKYTRLLSLSRVWRAP